MYDTLSDIDIELSDNACDLMYDKNFLENDVDMKNKFLK